MSDRYDDIIDLPRHVSQTHAPMPQRDRAAQFSPFAALTGYDAVINETGRQTQSRRIPDEQRKAEIDRCLAMLKKAEGTSPEICVTFFEADGRKNGGKYITMNALFRRLDVYSGKLLLDNGSDIAISDIWDIQSRIFDITESNASERE